MARDPWRAVLDEAESLRSRAVLSLGIPPISVPFEEPDEALGDLAFGCFVYAKRMRQSPASIVGQTCIGKPASVRAARRSSQRASGLTAQAGEESAPNRASSSRGFATTPSRRSVSSTCCCDQ